MRRSLLALLLVVLPIAAGAQGYVGRDDAVFTLSRALPSGGSLTVRNADGPIDVRESTTGKLELRAEKIARSGRGDPHDVAFEVRETGGGLRVCTVYRDQSACDDDNDWGNIRVSVHYTLAVPRDARLRVGTGNGDVSIVGTGADVDAGTGNGRVRISGSSGRVQVGTGNGEVTVEGATGAVRASTGNGRVAVTTSSGPVSVSTGNGDIDVRMQAVRSDATMTFQTGSGAIRLTLPTGYNGELDASTGNGTLSSDFDIRVHGRLDPQHIRGTIGDGGGGTLRLTTGNGRLELRKS